MIPQRFNLNVNQIFDVVVSSIHFQDELMHQFLKVAETEQLSFKETVTKRPDMIDHRLYQFVLASKLLEGKYPIEVIHLLCLSFSSDQMLKHLTLAC
jgi:hypothetical protein